MVQLKYNHLYFIFNIAVAWPNVIDVFGSYFVMHFSYFITVCYFKNRSFIYCNILFLMSNTKCLHGKLHLDFVGLGGEERFHQSPMTNHQVAHFPSLLLIIIFNCLSRSVESMDFRYFDSLMIKICRCNFTA